MRDKKGRFVKGHPAPKTAFKKGMIPWNKGTKGVMKKSPKAYIFPKGHPFYKGGEKTWYKKGHKQPKREKSPCWKGGQIIKDGYILVLMPEHPKANKRGYVKRAIVVMEKHLGRYLIPPELVHHKGIKYPLGSIENKQDDKIENLQLFPNRSPHAKLHCLRQ